MARRIGVTSALIALAVVASCSAGAPSATPTSAAVTTPAPVASSSRPTPAPTSATSRPSVAPSTAAAATTRPTVVATTVTLTPTQIVARNLPHLVGPTTTSQVVTVQAAGYGASYATVTAWQRQTSGTWAVVDGPYAGRIGVNGIAPPGRKQEGDGRTPTGSFPFTYFFGIKPNPGVAFTYRPITDKDYWDDDPQSANYNLWVVSPPGNPGGAPETMYQVPAYDYGAVIGYNPNRTPGAGSAIFLHVDTGSSTAGCIAIPLPDLLKVLRWLTPSARPRIVMGISSYFAG